MTATTLRFEMRQQHALVPRLQQAVRLLQMSSMDFAQELHQSVEQNPFLELEESEEAQAEPFPPRLNDIVTDAPAEAAVTEPDAAPASNAEGVDAGELDNWSGMGSSARAPGDGDLDFLDITQAEVPLRQHLTNQIGMMTLSPRDRALACLVAESVDDDGYLRIGMEDLMQCAADLDPPVDEAEIMMAIRLVQSLDPTGIGARDVKECLLLQLDNAFERKSEKALAQRIASEHIDLLARRDMKSLALLLNADIHVVGRICDRIRRLSPRPGFNYSRSVAQYIVPDVVVRKQRDKWEIALNPAVVPRLRVNRQYAEMFLRSREPKNNDLAHHLYEAKWAVRNVEQRFFTIFRVAQAIVEKQIAFFDFGPLAMKPLGLREIANDLGLHESTVSRTVNNKYMATPSGVFELKYFFSRGLDTSHGQPRSVTSVRSSIKQIIEGENAERPLSDAEIARLLGRRGLKVARRTVTKYRQLLHIPSMGMRRTS